MNHIAFVIPTLDRLGGAERQVVLLAKGLLERDWRVSIIALSGNGGEAAGELVSAGTDFLSLDMRKGLADPRGWFHFNRWLRRESPDVVHAHLPHAVWLARWSRLAAPVQALVDSIHTSNTGTWSRRIGYRCSNWFSDRVCAVSQGAADAYLSAHMVSAARLFVLPNGVDVNYWRPDPVARMSVRERLGLNDEFLWFAAGRLDPVKDYPALLWAMMEVAKPARLIIAGAGTMEGELRQLAIEHGLESRVRFLGFQSDIRSWMQAADAFVLCSRWEGLPMSLLEAGACAVPAVATDVAGSREILIHGQTGYLAASGSSLALRGAMTQMMRLSFEERRAMGEQARQRVSKHYSLSVVLDQWEAVYRELLASQRGAGYRRTSLNQVY